MSRSRKKTPCCHIVKKDTWWKGWFNRRIRRVPPDEEIPDGGYYRKMNCSYLIDDLPDVGRSLEDFWSSRDCAEEERRDNYERFYIRK